MLSKVMDQKISIRDVGRRAIRHQISDAALARFKSNGFHETTVEHIASDVGMSTRTFFRYFKSKDDVLLEAIYTFRERFLTSLKSNLQTANMWDALGAALEVGLLDCFDPAQDRRNREMHTLIRSTPALLARELEVFEKLQAEVLSLFAPQAASLGVATVNAVIGSAFACYHSSKAHLPNDATIEGAADSLQKLMDALRPAVIRS